MDAPMVSALPATAAAPHSDAMAAAPASAPEEEAVVVEDVPELRNLDAYEGGDDDEELPGIAPPPVARVAAEKRTGDKRRPLSHLTRLEFLTDLIYFLRDNGDGHLVSAAAGSNPYWFPEKKLNGKQLDLFALYKQVTSRGGFFVRSGNRHPYSWSGDIFPGMKHNYTRNHRATSVGHDLIKYYQTYLADYETAHPKDVVPYAALGATVAVRAAAAPLVDGERIQVWNADAKVWQGGATSNVNHDEGTVVVAFDDGRTETLKMATERWRRERAPSSLPSKKKRVDGGGGGRFEGDGADVLPAGSKRKRSNKTAAFWQDYVPTDAAFGDYGGHHDGGPQGMAIPLFAPPTFGQAAHARFRQRQHDRVRALGLAPVTRRTAALYAACDGRGPMPPARSVSEWLAQRNFSALAPLFAAHEIDLDVLPLLTGEDLEDIGVADMQQRLELLIYVTAEHNGRVADSVHHYVAQLSPRSGERLAGVNNDSETLFTADGGDPDEDRFLATHVLGITHTDQIGIAAEPQEAHGIAPAAEPPAAPAGAPTEQVEGAPLDDVIDMTMDE